MRFRVRIKQKMVFSALATLLSSAVFDNFNHYVWDFLLQVAFWVWDWHVFLIDEGLENFLLEVDRLDSWLFDLVLPIDHRLQLVQVFLSLTVLVNDFCYLFMAVLLCWIHVVQVVAESFGVLVKLKLTFLALSGQVCQGLLKCLISLIDLTLGLLIVNN